MIYLPYNTIELLQILLIDDIYHMILDDIYNRKIIYCSKSLSQDL